MKKGELITTVAEKLNITRESAENAVLTTLAAITMGLTDSGTVVIPNFGTFTVKQRAERLGRNLRTGETITVPAQKVVVFKAGKLIMGLINGQTGSTGAAPSRTAGDQE